MSTTQQTLAQMIRSKYPDSYKDMSDTDLEAAIVKKYPQYGDLPRTPLSRPIQDTSTLSAPPSLFSRLSNAFLQGGPVSAAEELGNATKEATSNVPLPGVHKTMGEGLEDLGHLADMASTEAGLLSLPEFGEGIVNKVRSLPIRSTLGKAVINPSTLQPRAGIKLLPGMSSERAAALGDVIDPNLPKVRNMLQATEESMPNRIEELAAQGKQEQLLGRENAAAIKRTPAELGSAANPGWMNNLPSRLPSSLRGDPFSPESPTQVSPSPFEPSVSVYPEPRTPLAEDRPGAMWSIPREELPTAATRGQPGAVETMRNLGRPLVLTPRGAVGVTNPDFMAVREAAYNPFSPTPEQVNPSPFSPTPQLRQEVNKMAMPSAASRVPEWQAGQVDAEISRLKGILRNPQATAEEQSVAASQLKDLTEQASRSSHRFSNSAKTRQQIRDLSNQ